MKTATANQTLGPNPSGICLCGRCGLPTRLAVKTRGKQGIIRGLPVRFAWGHNQRGIPRDPANR